MMSEENGEKKFLIVVTSGPEDAPLVKSALDIAVVAALYDADVEMIFTAGTKNLLLKGEAEKIVPIPNGDNLLEAIRLAKENGVKIYACSPLLDTYGYKKEDLIEEVDDIVGGSYLVSRSMESDVVLSF